MKEKLLTVIPFNLPWEWSTDYTNQTAFELSKGGPVICYMWCDTLTLKEYFNLRKFPILIKRYSKNIYIYTPILFVPFRRVGKIVKFNEKLNIILLKLLCFWLNKKHNTTKNVLWIFDPQTEPLTSYFTKTWKKIFDCVDFFTSTGKTKTDIRTAILEKKLTLNSDYVFANSIVLQNHLKKYRDDIVLVPQGFRSESFKSAQYKKGIPVIKKQKRPLIGFVGGVNQRLDYPLLTKLIKKHPEWDFALWGPILEPYRFKKFQVELYQKLLKLPNVITGQSDKNKIPGIISQFDIGMIPYDITDNFNKYCYPMKVFEFFYLGKPVVSTEIIELKRFPDLVLFGKNYKEWESKILKLLSKKWPQKYIKAQRKAALENSWENKVSQIINKIK